MTQDELDRLRTKFIPTWTSLRSIGNSRAVQSSAIFPVVGYLILLSSQFTSFFDGGLAGQGLHEVGWWSRLWASKLYYVYFGLLNLGIGSALYQWRCPRQIKKHGDWEDYVRIDGDVMTEGYVRAIGHVVGSSYNDDISSGETAASLRVQYLRKHYALLSAEDKYGRLAVTYFFVSGLALLAIPSLMTVVKIVILFIRNSIGTVGA
ncbi:hypothetical protein V1279_003230 [Bradyrhizobium sp. AZCC 1610]|uniref:hypothetical protein n=1 Tax=Bradyrhizobium sp. AZCC 1610 TaxID=3117020 RepID=UPI002FF40762